VIECQVVDRGYWLDDTEAYEHAHCLKLVKALSDICELHIDDELYTYHKGALVSHTPTPDHTHLDQAKIRFRPDKELFSYLELEYHQFFNRLKELAQLNPAVTFRLKDEKNENLLHFRGGLTDMLRENTNLMYLYDEPVELHFMAEGMEVSVSMSYGFGADVKLSYANNIRTYDGGAHVHGLYDGVLAAFEAYMETHMDETMALMEKHVVKRLNFVIHIKMARPPWQGSVKRGLGGKQVYLAVKHGVAKHLYPILASDPRFLEASSAICEADLREIFEDEETTP